VVHPRKEGGGTPIGGRVGGAVVLTLSIIQAYGMTGLWYDDMMTGAGGDVTISYMIYLIPYDISTR
jgi:hypothetical protein